MVVTLGVKGLIVIQEFPYVECFVTASGQSG